MKKIAFIDHSFKKQSLSSAFFIDLLKKDFDLEIFWDESWNDGPRVDLKKITEGSFDALILFQQMTHYTIKELNTLNCSVIMIPMYDSEYNRTDLFWYKHSNFKFINFSKTLHQHHLGIGIDSFYCQYFPSLELPDIYPRKKKNELLLKGFFWQRRSEITWSEVKKLIGDNHFAQLHIHTATDPPGYELVLPSKEDTERFNITTSNWFDAKDEYLKTVAESQIYFVPRLYEGIGIAFLEAMAMGKCVVAPDRPTMNEYITHGYNGLLYDPNDPEPLDFSNLEDICQNAQKSVAEGYNRWIATQQQLISFIAEPKVRKLYSLPVLRKRLKLRAESRKKGS